MSDEVGGPGGGLGGRCQARRLRWRLPRLMPTEVAPGARDSNLLGWPRDRPEVRPPAVERGMSSCGERGREGVQGGCREYLKISAGCIGER